MTKTTTKKVTRSGPLPLDQSVKKLLEKNRGRWEEVAVEADVSHSWISQFVRGVIKTPKYDTLNRVHVCLKPPPRKKAA